MLWESYQNFFLHWGANSVSASAASGKLKLNKETLSEV